MSACETNIKNSLIAKATQFFKENNSEITVMPIDRIQEQENVKTKLNVVELFDSNPELANAVYEALGFVPKMISREGQEYFNNPRIRFFVKIADEVRAVLPDVKEGYTRLYRGNRPSDLKSNPQFTNSLEGIALPFLMSYEGQLSYIDVPTPDLSKYVQRGGVATNAEFIVTSEMAKSATPIDNTIVEKYKEQYPDKLAPVEITPQQKQEAQQLYSQYLDTIFPDSKVKDIVYHSTSELFETFDKLKQVSPGFYFTPNSKSAYFGRNDIIYAVILNVKNPISNYKEITEIAEQGTLDAFIEKNYDGIVELQEKEEIIVFELEQIHILGSKQDIEGFKAFVESNNTKTNNSELNENTLTNNTNSIAKLNGINSQKLYDIQDFLDGLDPNLTRETVLEDWIEGDYLIFPEKKLIEAYTNTQFDEFKRKIEFQHKEDSKPIENTQDNKTFIFEKIVNSLKENGLSEKTIVLSNNEYNKRQLALFGRQVSSAGFTYNGIIYLNKDKMSPNTLIHENVHLWYAFMLSKNPRVINSAKKIIKDTQWYIDVKNEYKDVYTKESDFVEEAIVRMLSDNLYEKISSDEKITLEHLSIWKRIWDSIIDFINSITNKEYTLEDIQTIAYKDVFGKKAFQKLYNITAEDVKYAISNDYFDVVLKPSVMNNLNDTAIKNIIKDIRKTSQEIPDSFLTYNQAILNSLIGRRKRIDKFSENVIKDKDKIIEIIDKEIEFYYDNIIKLQDLGGNITWLSVINSEVEHLESTVNEISNKDIDYGQFIFRLDEIDRMFENNKDYSITELAEARTKVKELKRELKNIMQNAVEKDLVNQRFERAGKPLNDQEKEELGSSISNAVTQMFSDENDMALFHLFLGIKSGLKKTNQELGEYLINEVNENKQTYLASTSKLISELRMLENSLTSKDKLKRLFYTWDESGIIHKEQCLISPYKMVIEAKLEELSKLKSIILTTNNPHDIVENTKRYHAIVKKYFSIVVNAENLEEHRDYIIENFGDVEYETIKKKVEELYYEFNYGNSVDPENQVELKYEIFDEPVIEGYEQQSLYNFEFLIPKPEYRNEQFQEIIADPELYPIWERLNELLLSYQNPTISLYNKNYNKLGDNSGTTRRRIPIIASMLETQIEQFNQNPKYWRYIGDFFKRYVFCLTTQKEQAAIRKRLTHNIQTSSFNDNYFSKFVKLKKKYSYYSYQELLKLGRKAGVISSEYSENKSDYEYILDAVVKAEIASTSKYNIVDIVEAINLPLAEVFAGNMVKHRMKFIIELFKDNHNKYRALKNWYNLSILGETGVDNWQTKKLPIVGTFHSRAFKEWKNNQKELVDRGEYESLELENYYFDSDNMKDKPTYHSFKLSKDANKYYTVATSTGYEYYHGKVKIEEYEYNKAFKSLLDNDIIDDEAVYITFASLVNQTLLVKVVKDLALSIPAMLNNRRAGRLANEQTAAFGKWYNMEELLDARSFLYGSMASQSISNFATLGDIYKFKFFPQKKRENLRLFEKIIKYNNLIMQKNLYETDEGLNPNSFLLNFAIDIPEFLNQGEVLLAMLSRLEYDKRDENGNIIKGEKVKFFNGKTKEFELFDLKSNALQLKKGYESLANEILYRKEGKFRDTLIDFRYVNQMNQGNYSTDDRPYFFSQPLGRLLLNYMRWVPETVNRMYKGIRTPEEIKGRINVLTGEKEKIGIMTNLAKRPLMNITFHGLASLVSTGGIGSVLLGLGMGPAGVISVIALSSFAKAIITNKMVNGSWLLAAQNALEEEQTSIKRQINQTAAFLGNTLIRLMAELLPGQTPIVNKLRTKITDKANIQLGWDDILLDTTYEKAASLRADMMQAREASLILASEMKKFIMVTFLSTLGVTLIAALLGDGGDDDDDNKSKKKGITKTLEEIELKERKTAIARGISNKLINLYTQGFDSNQFAVSFSSILNPFMPTSNPSIRNMSMTYSNTVNFIKMYNGKLAYTPARMEKALIYGNIAIPFPSKITHSIIDIMYLMEDNNYTLEERTINLVLKKRTIFTDTRVYGQGQVPLLQLLDNNNRNKHYQEKWDVLWGENKDEMFKLYMKSKYGEKKLGREERKLGREEQKTFDRKYSDAKNAIRDQYITDEFKSGVDYIEMFNFYKDIIKKQIKEKNYKWFMTTTGKKKINVKEED